MKVKCSECNGRGFFLFTFSSPKCHICNGKGEYEKKYRVFWNENTANLHEDYEDLDEALRRFEELKQTQNIEKVDIKDIWL